MITQFLRYLWLGKEQTKSFNVGIHVATITDDNGRIFTITRTGEVMLTGFGPFLYDSQSMLHDYLSGKSTILTDDRGNKFPVCKINNIDIKYTSKWEEITWRQ